MKRVKERERGRECSSGERERRQRWFEYAEF